MQKYKIYFSLLFLFISLACFSQSDQFINTALGGRSMNADDGLKMVVGTNGNVHVFRRDQTQYYWSNSNSGVSTTCGIWNDVNPSLGYTSSKGVQLGFRFEKNGVYNANQPTWRVCSTTAAEQDSSNPNRWTTAITGYVTSPISNKKFFVTMNYEYIHPNNFFTVDYHVRAPFDLLEADQEILHIYLYHDSYILGLDGSRPYETINTTGHFVGDYRNSDDKISTTPTTTYCQGANQNPRFPSTHGFKASSVGYRSYRSGPYRSGSISLDASTIQINNAGIIIPSGSGCADDEVGVEFVTQPLYLGRVSARRILHCYGNQKGEFDNLQVDDPVVSQGDNQAIKVEFTSPSFSENEGDAIHRTNVTIRVSQGKLAQSQICNFTVNGGNALQGTNYSYAKGFTIPAGDYSSPVVFTLNNIDILGNVTCDPVNRNFNISIDPEDCNDLISRGTQYTTTYTIIDDDQPTVNVPNNATYCSGISVPTGTFNFTGVKATSYSWTCTNNTALGITASGTGSSLPAFTTNNTGTTPIVATITVTPVQSCNGDPKSFTITVNPFGQASNITVADQTICYNTKPTFTISNPIAGAVYRWYNDNTTTALSATGTTFTAPTALTANRSYYVSIEQAGIYCENLPANRKAVTATVLPALMSGTITGNPYVCSGSVPQTIKGTLSSGGSGELEYSWQSSSDGMIWNNISGANGVDYTPGALTQRTYYKRITTDKGASCGTIESNAFIINIAPNDLTYTWKGTAGDYDWNNPANWDNNKGFVNTVPLACTDVHIPGGAATYPSLDDLSTPIDHYGSPVAKDLILHYGGQISYPHKLTYQKAHIQYNFGYYGGLAGPQPTKNAEGSGTPMLQRDRWYLLSAPLKNVVSGDFTFAGYPITWQSVCHITNPVNSHFETADLSKPYPRNDIPLTQTNNAFALKVAGQENVTGKNNHKHLETLQGILQLPYLENPSYPGHQYDPLAQVSRLFYFNTHTLQQLTSPVGAIKRGPETYRFLHEDPQNNNKPYTITVSGQNTIGYQHPVTTEGTNRKILVGNPFISSLNPWNLYQANQDILENSGYDIYDGQAQLWKNYSFTTTNNIAPLQAFVLTLKPGITSGTLKYPLEGQYPLTRAGGISAQPLKQGNDLYIKTTLSGQTDNSAPYAVIQSTASTPLTKNVKKLITPQDHAIAEPFLVSPDGKTYNQSQPYHEGQTTITLGIKTSDTNQPHTLTFENIDNFIHQHNVYPVLEDRYLGIRQDITLYPRYTFTQRTVTGDNYYADADRFVLRFYDEPIATSQSEDITITYQQKELKIASTHAIKQVTLYTLLGQTIHHSGTLPAQSTYTYNRHLPLSQGVYIVKVQQTDGKIVTKKITVF